MYVKMRGPRNAAESSGTSRAPRSVIDKPPGALEAYRQPRERPQTMETEEAMKASKPEQNVKTPKEARKGKESYKNQCVWDSVKPGRARQGREGPARAMKSQSGPVRAGQGQQGPARAKDRLLNPRRARQRVDGRVRMAQTAQTLLRVV